MTSSYLFFANQLKVSTTMTVLQINLRAKHVEFLDHQFRALRGREAVPIEEYSAQYVK